MKAAARSDFSLGGPDLAAPIVVGGGNRALPEDVRINLELVDERRFGSGVVHLHYRTTS